MTIQTPAHVHPYCWPGYRHLAYITVASFTIDACSQVSLMAEVDEAGLLIYAIPGDWFASFPVASQSLDRLIVGGHDGVAAHAFLHGRDACDVGPHCARVAVQTLYASLDMRLVAVGNGLFRGGIDLDSR